MSLVEVYLMLLLQRSSIECGGCGISVLLYTHGGSDDGRKLFPNQLKFT